ncbi:rhamnogalacturonan acetylesterase [Streptomyces sp. NPDC093109]|uniref:rhamnogalacturonan acetylesterase n=1 Tax=Streptomyces sp. NPDC093109 TaxID=3154977 RepID=UPI0034509B04
MSISRRQASAALSALPPAVITGTGTGAASAPARPRRTVHIAGDSTAAGKYASAAPETGWGMALPFLLGNGIAVANHAVNGRSSKSFIDEGRLATLLGGVRPGDLLLVQFGHNDEKSADPTRYTEPWSTYQDCLRQYLKGARDAGAGPVLLTSVERRKFDAAGGAVATHGEYPAAVRALAAEERVPLLDVQASSLALWQELGPEATKTYFNWLPPGESPNYPDGVSDNTHSSPTGAVAVARLVARALRDERVLAAGEVRRLEKEIPVSWLRWLDSPVP